MSLQHVDSLDGEFLFSSRVDGTDSEHGLDGKRSEEVVIANKINDRDEHVYMEAELDLNSRSQDLTAHRRFGNVDQAVLSKAIHLRAQLFHHEPTSLFASQSVTRDDRGRVDFVSDQFVGALKKGRSDEDNRGSSVSNLFVLLRGKGYEDTSLREKDYT